MYSALMLRTFVRRLLGSREKSMLKIGDPAPAFEALDHHGNTVRLSDLADKRFVLWFYPLADTPG